MTNIDPFAHDDAAYVLGALSPQERTAFEQHLATCAECQANVAEIKAIPNLLAGITEADLAEAAHMSTPPDTLRPSLLRAAHRERVRRRRIVSGVAGVAAAAIIALSLALIVPSGGQSTPKPVAFTALISTPVSATAVLQDKAWGTSITLTCHYQSAYASSTEYQLVVVDRAGRQHSGGTWKLTPGKTTSFPGGTAVPRSQIASIEIAAGTMPILQLNL